MSHKNKMIMLGVGVVALIAAAAGASAYVATNIANDEPAQVTAKKENIRWDDPKPAPQEQQVAQNECDDANIVGAAIGAVGGGLVGNQIGSGSGQDLATIGGAIGGGYLGQQHIPTRNVLCP